MPAMETRRMVAAAVAAAESKKAEDTRVLELDPSDSGFTDFFLIASALNERQAQAIAEEIERRLKRDFGALPNSIEGLRRGEWVLMDYVDFVVHIFLREKRAYYDIERLRKSARAVDPRQWKTPAKRASRAKKAVKSTKSKGSGVRGQGSAKRRSPTVRRPSKKTKP